ncbi:unnamed protein product [Sphacelaria rigidula]
MSTPEQRTDSPGFFSSPTRRKMLVLRPSRAMRRPPQDSGTAHMFDLLIIAAFSPVDGLFVFWQALDDMS